MKKTWLITGVSRGLGLALARAALTSGDTVVGTVRDSDPGLPGLRVAKLDVRQPDSIEAVVREAGAVDILVNNAGFGLLGSIEDATDADIAQVFEVNLFGPMRLVRAVLPGMRQRGSGRIINVTSIAGRAPGAGSGVYSAAKAGLEGYSAALAQELSPLGIHVTAVAPGAFRTDFLSSHSIRKTATMSDAYSGTVGGMLEKFDAMHGKQVGDPDKAATAIMTLAASPTPPVHLLLGSDALTRARTKLDTIQSEIAEWSAVTVSTNFASPA